MNYLLVNHVPFGRGRSPGTVMVGDMWLEDLRAQRRAISEYGRLHVATPLHECLDRNDSGSFNLVEVDPAIEGFEYHPLPPYLSLKGYWGARSGLQHAMGTAITKADVVQADYGGHPIALGRLAWSIARRTGVSRIWLFDGADPFPRLQRAVAEEPNRIRRLARRAFVNDFERFCGKAVRTADLVFAHNEAVAQRFRTDWNGRCHLFPRSFVKDDILLSREELESRNRWLVGTKRPLRLVVAGRQIAIKATDHVLKAMAIAQSNDARTELTVLGDGGDLEQFRQLAIDLGIADSVEFAGQVPYGQPLFEAWAHADALVITNLTDEISRNVFLGMARGLPLIMYRNPGTDQLIQDSGSGVLVPRGDVKALAACLGRLAQNREALASSAVCGLELAAKHTIDACHRSRARLAASLGAKQ
jgi:glycosyltransferase involved in cell wall biosynthesis